MNKKVTLANLISLIRKSQGLSQQTVITESTLLEKDLGITGDDGCELLEAMEKAFGVSFIGSDNTIREIFALQDDEYLFHSEGMELFSLLASLLGRDVEKVKALTVGQLYEAVCRARDKTENSFRI